MTWRDRAWVHGYKGFYGANYTCDDQHDVITPWLGGYGRKGEGGSVGSRAEARLSTAWPVWISASNNRPAFAPGLSDKGKDISRRMRVVDSINLNSIHGETEFNFCRVLFRVVYFVERSIRNNGVKNRRD